MKAPSELLCLPPLSLYIHMPWCIRKCPYCDFNSHETNGPIPEAQYIDALIDDLSQELAFVQSRQISSVFIGGGTPSLFSPDSVERILGSARKMVPFASNAEITLEANPGTIEAQKFYEFKMAGINRLSIGVQSFKDNQLTRLGRIHNGAQAYCAAERAHAAGFENFNLDLMFGLPEQTVDDAIDDVQTAIDLNPTHVSYYQLTIEPNTYFHKFRPSMPSGEQTWDIQTAGQKRLALSGFRQYEISAYSKRNYQCQHNLNYWRFGDYIGIGAGAHGKITRIETQEIFRYWKIRRPADYIRKASDESRVGGLSNIEKTERPFEFLMNNLRLRRGFGASDFVSATGLGLGVLEPPLAKCIADGLLESHKGRIGCTETGWNFLDEVLQRFYPNTMLHEAVTSGSMPE